MRILLQGGTVVSAEGTAILDVLLEGERIAAVGENLSSGDARIVDCTGKLLFPGFIDGHTHFDLEVGGPSPPMILPPAPGPPCGGAPPRLSTLPPQTRGKPWPPVWPAGRKRPEDTAPATTAFT